MRDRSCAGRHVPHCTEVSPGGELFCEEHTSTPHEVHWAKRRDGSQVTWLGRAGERRTSKVREIPPKVPLGYRKMKDAQVIAVTRKAIKVESPDLDGEIWVPRMHVNDQVSDKVMVGKSITLVVTNFFARLIGLPLVLALLVLTGCPPADKPEDCARACGGSDMCYYYDTKHQWCHCGMTATVCVRMCRDQGLHLGRVFVGYDRECRCVPEKVFIYQNGTEVEQ